MYTFVYRTFINFIFFCRGQALDVLYKLKMFQTQKLAGFNALMGLSCYRHGFMNTMTEGTFQCPHGLELLRILLSQQMQQCCFNALTGLYLISTSFMPERLGLHYCSCQCPLGLIPHFYGTPSKT